MSVPDRGADRTMSGWLDVPVPMLMQGARFALVGLACALPISSKASYLFTIVALVSWLAAGGFRTHARALRSQSFFGWAALLLGWTIVGTTWSSASPHDAWAQVGRYANLLIVPIALTALDAQGWPRRVLVAFMAAMGFTLALTLIDWVYPIQIPALRIPQGVHSIFRHHIIQGAFMSLFVVGALFQARWHTRGALQVAWITLALTGAFSVLYLSPGRTGYLALLLSMPWVLVNRQQLPRFFAAMGAVLLLTLIAASFSGTLQERVQGTIDGLKRSIGPEAADHASNEPTQEMISGASGSTFVRFKLGSEAALIGLERAAVGKGTGSFREAFCARTTQRWCQVMRETSSQPHNQFLFLFAELGLIGVLLFAALLASPNWMSRHAPQCWRQLTWAVTVVIVVHACLDSVLHLATEGLAYLLLLSALVVQSVRFRHGNDETATIAR